MAPKIKNAIMFIGIALVLVAAYFYFFGGAEPEEGLVSYTDDASLPEGAASSALDQDFLPLLLSVKTIKLDDSIFSDPAFLRLKDGSIELVPDSTEGRPNPFAPLGAEAAPAGLR